MSRIKNFFATISKNLERMPLPLTTQEKMVELFHSVSNNMDYDSSEVTVRENFWCGAMGVGMYTDNREIYFDYSKNFVERSPQNILVAITAHEVAHLMLGHIEQKINRYGSDAEREYEADALAYKFYPVEMQQALAYSQRIWGDDTPVSFADRISNLKAIA